LTIGGAGGQPGLGGSKTVNNTEASGLTGHLWRSDHPGTGVGCLTTLYGGQTTRGYFGSPKTLSFRKLLRVFLVIQTLITLRDFQN
jgi:hypothetical protein